MIRRQSSQRSLGVLVRGLMATASMRSQAKACRALPTTDPPSVLMPAEIVDAVVTYVTVASTELWNNAPTRSAAGIGR